MTQPIVRKTWGALVGVEREIVRYHSMEELGDSVDWGKEFTVEEEEQDGDREGKIWVQSFSVANTFSIPGSCLDRSI